MYVNVGVRYVENGKDIPTKKALKEELQNNPSNVVLYTTSELSTKETVTGDKLMAGVRYSVTGPNPYTSRKWYATIERTVNGNTKVS